MRFLHLLLVGAAVLAALSAQSSSGQQNESVPQLHFYDLYVSGKRPSREDGERYSKRLAKFLADNELTNTCVDLKRDLIPGKGLAARLVLLMNQDIPAEKVQHLTDALCAGETARCSVQGTKNVQNVSGLSLVYVYGSMGIATDFPDRKTRRIPIRGLKGAFPNFSKSCKTGNAIAAALGTATSHESRALLAQSGVNMKNSVRFGLATKDGQDWWNFGMPDLYWNDRPVTEEDQPLAPKDILDELK